MGRQLRAWRIAIDAGARSGVPRRRRSEPRVARGRCRSPRRRDDVLVRRLANIARRGITWKGRSPCSNPAMYDDDLAFRFGHDAGASAMFIAWRLRRWPLGEVDRAVSLIDRMQTRIREALAHVGTLAPPLGSECTRPCSN